MQIEDLSQLNDAYGHIYLSPHLDDAALSCGGAIAAHVAAGARVLVVTLCTAPPAPDAQFSDLALEFHRYWALDPAEVVTARLREERLAMERLGADSYWAGMLDAIYRYPEAYHSRASLFGTPAPNDPLLPVLRQFIGALRERTPGATLYAPLGVGSHVDHLITYAAALDSAGDGILFYEDVPYVIKTGALESRLAAVEETFSARVVNIDRTLGQKINAIEAYASQLEELFGSAEAMIQAIGDYAKGLQPEDGVYGERLWIPVAPPKSA